MVPLVKCLPCSDLGSILRTYSKKPGMVVCTEIPVLGEGAEHRNGQIHGVHWLISLI